jgi:hypothetical protein
MSEAKNDSLQRLVRQALDSFRSRYRVQSADEIVATSTPGYWEFVKECRGECRGGHTVPFRHTLSYAEHGVRGPDGKWVKPFRAWEAWRAVMPNSVISVKNEDRSAAT